MSMHLSVALQEWSACCRALTGGALTLLVRKGGIHERGGGLFAPEHDRFALLPSYLHQDPFRLRPAYDGLVGPDPRPGTHLVPGWAAVERTWKVTDLDRLLALGDDLLWTADELATRFRYRDQPWLFVLLLRVQRFPEPVVIPDHPAYAGCRSWIPLRDPVPTVPADPVLDDAAFTAASSRMAGILG
jgi:hypothetical protein